MKANSILRIAAAVCCAGVLAACSDSNRWTVNGKITGAEGQTMVLESSENGRWFVIDSVEINDAGQFKASHKAPGYPDIYRLRLGDKTIYFPIDSIESVTVVTSVDAFDNDYTISGSASADQLMAADRKVSEAIKQGHEPATDSLLKRDLGKLLMENPSGIVSYYIINKRVKGAPIFIPTNKADLRIIGAVANAYTQYRPNDPRTKYLTNLFLSSRAAVNQPTDTIVAPETSLIDVDLFDAAGVRQNLDKVAAKNKVVLLNFTAYGADFSPALNVVINRIWERFHSAGFQVYQVSVDTNEVLWRQAAKNVPWISVYSPQNDARVLAYYNVNAIPTSFIIHNGSLVERVEEPSKLESAVARYF